MGFYKIDNEELLQANNTVYAPDYTLVKENKDNYTYPINGWYWFDTIELAAEFFGISLEEEEENKEAIE